MTNFRRWLSVLTVGALFMINVTMVHAESQPPEPDGTRIIPAEEVEGDSYLEKFVDKDKKNPITDDIYSEDDIVTIIVELKGKSLLEQSNGDLQSFISKGSADAASSKLDIEQTRAKKEIEKLLGKEIKIEYRYNAITNGFSFKTEFKNLEEIRNMSMIKNAVISNTYDRVEPQMSVSNSTIGATNIWNNTGYKGAGIVVAVIDSGLDVNHEAFQQDLTDVSITKDDVANAINNLDLNAEYIVENITADDVYVSSKIPFVFDYADHDIDVNSDNVAGANEISHGTHVSGTVGGFVDGKFSGVAPEAQIIQMKVFSDIGGQTGDDVVLAAIEDAVYLDVDIINMSLGSRSGYTDDDDWVNEVYERVYDSGIILNVSAGNETNAAIDNLWGGVDKTPAGDIDHGMVGRPSTFGSALSVASVDNTASTLPYIKIDETNEIIGFSNTVNSLKDIAGEPKKLIFSDGYGSLEEMMAIAELYPEVADGGYVIALSRGGINEYDLPISFSEKMLYAELLRFDGIIIYNNQGDELINMLVEDTSIPAAFISKSDGAKLKSQHLKTITVGADDGVFENVLSGGQISSFSSRGTTNDLRIKPEISAPGGNIYSTVPEMLGDGYSSMSGTSMAAPNVSGAAALVKQFVETEKGVSGKESVELVNQLLMSSAIPVYDADGVLAPIRAQGAGTIHVGNALAGILHLSNPNNPDGTSRPKLEIGDNVSKNGKYTLTFKVHNDGTENADFDIRVEATAPTVKEYTFTLIDDVGTETELKKSFMNESNRNLAITGGVATVNVPAGQSKEVTVTFTLTDAEITKLDEEFENGAYVEGFAFVTKSGDSRPEATASIPFLGFHGDWEQAPIFDHCSWFDEMYLSNNFVSQIYTDYSYILGASPLYQDQFFVNKEMITISPNGDDMFDGIFHPFVGLIRNARHLKYTIRNKDTNEIVFEYDVDYVTKTSPNNNGVQTPHSYDYRVPAWLGTDNDGNPVKDGKYEFRIEAELGYREGIDDVYSFDFTVDTVKPTIKDNSFVLSKEGDRTFLSFTSEDNNYLSHTRMSPVVEDGNVNWHIWMGFEDTPVDAVNKHELKVDVTDYVGTTVAVLVVDTGANQSIFLASIPADNAKDLSMPYDSMTLKLGESVTLGIVNNTGESLTWSTSNDSVVSVDQHGFITAKNVGQATITATTPSGIKADIIVGVYADIELTDVELFPNNNFDLEKDNSGIITVVGTTPVDTALNVENMQWTSSDPDAVRVTAIGGRAMVFAAGAVGSSATITFTYGDVVKTIVVTVVDNSNSEFSLNINTLTHTLEIGGQMMNSIIGISSFENMTVTEENGSILDLTYDGNGNFKIIATEVGETQVVIKNTSTGSYIVMNIKVVNTPVKYSTAKFEQDILNLTTSSTPITPVIVFGPENALPENNTVVYNSYDPTVATFINGVVTPISNGSTIIEVVLGNGKRASALVVVGDVDCSELQALIDTAKTIDLEIHTETSGTALKTVIDDAEAAIQAGITLEDHNTLVTRLTDAINDLEKLVIGLPTTIKLEVGQSMIVNPVPADGTWINSGNTVTITPINTRAQTGFTITAINPGTETISYQSGTQTVVINVEIVAKVIDPTVPVTPIIPGGPSDPTNPNKGGTDPNTGINTYIYYYGIILGLGILIVIVNKNKRKYFN